MSGLKSNCGWGEWGERKQHSDLQAGQKGVEKYAWFIVTVQPVFNAQSRRPTAARVDGGGGTTYIWQAKIELSGLPR